MAWQLANTAVLDAWLDQEPSEARRRAVLEALAVLANDPYASDLVTTAESATQLRRNLVLANEELVLTLVLGEPFKVLHLLGITDKSRPQ